MNRETALEIVREHVENENLIRHMLAVEAAMRFYAEKFGEDADQWGLAGLLHDFDWEIVRAILSHAEHTGVPRQSNMEKALYACDEITGLIVAVALVRPSRSLSDLKVKSVKKKWKDRSFAAGANREDIAEASEEFGVELWEHVDNVIRAMAQVAPDLGFDS
jgi:predicted hydrolase (HD superfamily)